MESIPGLLKRLQFGLSIWFLYCIGLVYSVPYLQPPNSALPTLIILARDTVLTAMPQKFIFLSVCWISKILGLLDPEPDPLVAGTDQDTKPNPSFIKQNSKKTLCTLPSKSTKQKNYRKKLFWRSLTKREGSGVGSGSVPKRHGSGTLIPFYLLGCPPDPGVASPGEPGPLHLLRLLQSYHCSPKLIQRIQNGAKNNNSCHGSAEVAR